MSSPIMRNWYVKFNNYDNVFALIPNKVQIDASTMSLHYGAAMDADNVTLTLLKRPPNGQ